MSKCIDHPCAPHGFNRGASHANGEYVCDCAWWEPPEGCSGAELYRALALMCRTHREKYGLDGAFDEAYTAAEAALKKARGEQ